MKTALQGFGVGLVAGAFFQAWSWEWWLFSIGANVLMAVIRNNA